MSENNQWNGQYNSYYPPQQPNKKSGVGSIIIASLCSGIIGASLVVAGTNSLSEFGGSSETPVVQNIKQNVSGGINWESTTKTASPSVVTIQVDNGNGSGGEGSGVVYNKEGLIITNNHVVGDKGATVRVSLGNKSYSAHVVGSDPTADIALLKIKASPNELHPIKFFDSDKVNVGQQVMAIGSPLGLSDTATTGIVSALKRPVITPTKNKNDVVVTNAIQTSAPINPGNSGGALVNYNGELIGINSSIATLNSSTSDGAAVEQQSGSIGIGFAIPSNTVKNIVEQIIKNGSAKHAMLGVQGESTIASRNGDSGVLGVKITYVKSDGAADKAGINTGDTVIKVNGDNTTSFEELVATIREHNPGDKITLTVITKYGQTKDIKATLN